MAQVDIEQFRIRPTLRVAGCIFMLLFAALMIYSSIPFFSAEKVLGKSCEVERKLTSRFFCEVGNAMLSVFPERMQGPVEALLHLGMAGLLFFLSWLLIKPLFEQFAKKTM